MISGPPGAIRRILLKYRQWETKLAHRMGGGDVLALVSEDILRGFGRSTVSAKKIVRLF